MYLTLTFECKVVFIFRDVCCILNMIGNHFAKNEHTRSKIKRDRTMLLETGFRYM